MGFNDQGEEKSKQETWMKRAASRTQFTLLSDSDLHQRVDCSFYLFHAGFLLGLQLNMKI
jgi:hypothetical protein